MNQRRVPDQTERKVERGGGATLRARDAVQQAILEGHDQLVGYLRKRLRSQQEAEEVLQQFVLRALERAEDLRDVVSVRGWLARVLATTTADFLRRKIRTRRRETSLSGFDELKLTAPVDSAADRAACACLYSLLPTIGRAQADIIRRIDLLHEPRGAVAKSLGITLNSANVRLHRARQALRKRLMEACVACRQESFLDCDCEEPAAKRKS